MILLNRLQKKGEKWKTVKSSETFKNDTFAPTSKKSESMKISIWSETLKNGGFRGIFEYLATNPPPCFATPKKKGGVVARNRSDNSENV